MEVVIANNKRFSRNAKSLTQIANDNANNSSTVNVILLII